MRILFLSPIGNVGGAERVLLTAMAGVRKECPDAVVRLISLSDGPLLKDAARLGVEVEVVQSPKAFSKMGDSQVRGRGWLEKLALVLRMMLSSPGGILLVARLRWAIRRFAPDIVLSNGIKTHLLSRFAVPRGVPLVWHIHDFYSLRPAAAQLLPRFRGRVQAALAISNAVATDAAKILPGCPITTLLNSIELCRFSPDSGDGRELDRLAGLPIASPETVRVGLVATYARWKGHLTFLDAAAKLADESTSLPIRWYIVGGPIYHTAAQFTEAELRAAAAERNLGTRIGFIGYTSDTPGIYRSLDVVVQASTLPEPFGLTIVEAMACGRAVVISAAGGAIELFTDGTDALGFEPGNVSQLAEMIKRLAENPEDRFRLGAAARRTAEARFDANHYGSQLLAVFRSLMPARAE